MTDRVPLPGSEPPFRRGTTVIGPADPAEVATVSVVLRLPPAEDVDPRTLTLEQKRKRFGARPEHVQAVVDFGVESGLEVVDARPEARTVRLRGSLAAMGAAFGVGFERHAHPAGAHRAQVGPVTVPAALAPQVAGVMGLDQRPVLVSPDQGTCDVPAATSTPLARVRMVMLHADFALPDADGTGQYIGIIAASGSQYESGAWFEKYHLPVPDVSWKSVDGGTISATGNGEPLLDISMTGIVAPGAKIVAYYHATPTGMHDAIMMALTDGATVISISYGGPEQGFTTSDRACIDQALEAASRYGTTVCVSSCDCGAGYVGYPAVSPWALACGGTQIPAGSSTQEVWSNQVGSKGWMGSGGGVSQFYPVPAYQSDNGILPVSVLTGAGGRGVPDVAGLADGIETPAGAIAVGTSASAPFWAGVVARLNQAFGQNVGYLNPVIYGWGQTSDAFTDITAGNNIPPSGKGYSAAVGWDACTGLGTPRGNAMLAKLEAGAAARAKAAP